MFVVTLRLHGIRSKAQFVFNVSLAASSPLCAPSPVRTFALLPRFNVIHLFRCQTFTAFKGSGFLPTPIVRSRDRFGSISSRTAF